MKHILLLCMSLMLVTVSCKRKDIHGDLKQRRDILKGHNWKLIRITDNGGTTSLPICQIDNYYVFETNGTGRYEEGTLNCLDSTGTGNAPSYTSFRWEMTGDLRNLYFLEYAGDPERRFEWEILNMTYDELKVRQTLHVDGIDHRLDMTFFAMNK
ncbi:MAG: lipocalin family protein [Chitinophagaceae bacterium]|nr:lipocalin family protein [Chitinophagaceae bacterium]